MNILIVSLSKISKAFLKNLPKNFDGTIDVFSPNSTIEGFKCFNYYRNIDKEYNYVFLGCKPQHIQDVAENLPTICYNKNTIFISVLAGVTVTKIVQLFGVEKVIRVMPSLAFEFGDSYLGMFGKNCTNEEIRFVCEMFKPNTVIKCKNEQEIDEFTALYGSGIGFIFEVMDAFFESSKTFLEESSKREIIVNLLQNAAVYMKENKDISFVEAVGNVASKGGTTEAGLNEFQKNNQLKEIINNAIQASLKRAREIAKS